MEKEYEELYFTEEQLCQLSRAELKICDHPDFNSIEDFDFDCVEADAVIDVTFEDMVMAVKNLKNYSPSEFVYDWYIPTFETLSDHIKFTLRFMMNLINWFLMVKWAMSHSVFQI